MMGREIRGKGKTKRGIYIYTYIHDNIIKQPKLTRMSPPKDKTYTAYYIFIHNKNQKHTNL